MRKTVALLTVALISALAATLLLATVSGAGPVLQLALTGIEPETLVGESGGRLSVYGSGFTTATVSRLVGYGLLDTTFVNSEALQAVVPPGVPAGIYGVQVSEAAISGSG